MKTCFNKIECNFNLERLGSILQNYVPPTVSLTRLCLAGLVDDLGTRNEAEV